ncbi:hypothetical protein ACQY0O_004470 [Thecaphora frezii]
MSSTPEHPRARDEQILSAKKKLKSFRAKQAQMARAQPSSSTASSSAVPLDSVASSSSVESGMQVIGAPRRHSRAVSRSGHGRGHSRAGSISISSQTLAAQMATSNATSSGYRPFSAGNASGNHVRSHSRSNSRSLAARTRPSSLLLGGHMDGSNVLIAEQDAGDRRGAPISPVQPVLVAGQPEPSSDVSSLFISSQQAGLAGRQSYPSAIPEQDFSSGLRSAPLAPPSSTAIKHERRQSRHTRRASVSTKRESMEIMGGIGLGMTSSRSSESLSSNRRKSSRMSGLPSASVLFGVPEASDRRQSNWDCKDALASGAEERDSEESRLTALEKLEGRLQPAAAVHTQQTSNQISRPQSRQSRRFSGHQRQSSVQLPSFEEVHGADGMDRGASTQLIEANEKTTSEMTSPGLREGWRSSLGPPPSASAVHPPKSPTQSLTLVTSQRPESIIIHPEASQPEALGTLLEEEEEEESLSPVRERRSIDTPLSGSSPDDEEMRRQRRLAEEETVRRNRRASLTPRPLKLKSRPASLYLAPSLGSGMLASVSLPNLARSNPSSPAAPTIDLDKTPRLESNAALQPEPSTPKVESAQAKPSPNLVKSWSFANAQQKLLNQELESATVGSDASSNFDSPQPEIVRAYRTSMVFSPPTANGLASSPNAPRERQGMRTLRLGSHRSSLASLSSVAESSCSSDSISLGSSIASNRRRSLVRTDSGTVSLTQEELGNGLPSTATVRNARRSSIHYKPSAHHDQTESISGHKPAPSLASLGGVPIAVYDELKNKSSRDAALLESTKEQVERLQRELTVETERCAREYAELERWSAEEKKVLSARLDSLEKSAGESAQQIAELHRELGAAKESMEDLEAERDVLRDDVEGWRSRCQDLEKSLRSDRAKLEDQRKLKNAAKLRIQQLTAALEQHDIAVPADQLNLHQALDDIQLDVATVLRSPALSSASPVLGGGYFSPAAADPPPMTIKLLADMRQQIFNLAGSLEHERSEHLKAKDELARLQEEHMQALNRSQSFTNTSFTTSDTADDRRETSPVNNMPEKRRTSSGVSVVGKNKRHVFAYDSSMGSFGQSSTSLGSASLSMTTDESATDDEGANNGSPRSKAPGTDGELAGSGMGSLQTLDEIEEVSESGIEDSSTTGVSEVDRQPVEMETSWTDVEAGIVDGRPSVDASESSFGGRPYEDAAASFTPAAATADHGSRSTGSSLESNIGPTTPPLDHHSNGFLPDDASTVSSPSPSPRPEFIPDWNFEMAVRRGRLSRSAKGNAIEDFFGIMQETSLPPLPTSDEAIDMPPIRLNARGEAAIVSRQSTRVASAIGRRPPVARSAYTHESFSESDRSYGDRQAHSTSSFSGPPSAAAFGSRALSRMSLQGITSAFSGLSGYLTNQSGAAVTAAAAATKMCSGPDGLLESDSVHASLSWTAQRRALDDEDERGDAYGRGGAFTAGRSMSTDLAASNVRTAKVGVRHFVDPASMPTPVATPVWQLDFANSTVGGPVFSL